MEWLIFYGDRSTYTGQVTRTPALNVQAIAQADEEVGRFILSRRDYYWWEKGRWWGGDIFGLFDYLQRPGWKKVLFGRSLPNEEFNAIMAMAVNHEGLPRKSAWSAAEDVVEGVNL